VRDVYSSPFESPGAIPAGGAGAISVGGTGAMLGGGTSMIPLAGLLEDGGVKPLSNKKTGFSQLASQRSTPLMGASPRGSSQLPSQLHGSASSQPASQQFSSASFELSSARGATEVIFEL